MKLFCKIILILIFQSIIINQQSFSQTAPAIEWQNTIGGSEDDEIFSIQQTIDGGFVLGGWSFSGVSGDKIENNWDTSLQTRDYWIIKTDSSGNIQWQNTIGGNYNDVLNSIQQTMDNGFILGGISNSPLSGDKTENSNGALDYWLVKTDFLGNIQWQNTIGGNNDDELQSVKQTSDGGFILGGWSRSNISGDKTEDCIGGILYSDYWVVKIDSLGIIQWQNTVGGNYGDILYSIQQTTDGGYILGGSSGSNISGDKTENNIGGSDYWIVKIDSIGNLLWQNTIGGNLNDILYSIEQTSDAGYILAGNSWSNISGDKTENSNGGEDYWIVKTDSLGAIEWQNTIGGNTYEERSCIRQTLDGGYILAGSSLSNISGDKTENSNGTLDFWIIKLDALGNIQWQNTIGGNSWDWVYSVHQTAYGGYILGGFSNSNISGDKTENSNGFYDYWIVKLSPDTITGIAESPLERGKGYVVLPNPLTTQSIITFSNPHREKFLFTLYDITGRVVETVSTATEQIILNKGSKQPGVYLFHLDKLGVTNEKTGERMNGKIVISN